jgi:hypothetical protein
MAKGLAAMGQERAAEGPHLDEFAEQEVAMVRRRRALRPILIALLAVLVAALLALWTQRGPIASNYVDRELAKRGVQARYEITTIGFRKQRLANLVIGDPARPDLVARSVEVRTGWSLSGPKISSITARGVRLYGRLVDGRLDLGQVDRLLPKSTGGPFRLPDQYVDLADAGMSLQTEAGRIGIGVEGRGKLSDGFRGRLAIASRALSPGNCRLTKLRGNWAVTVADLAPHLVGPARLEGLACGANLAAGPTKMELDARLQPGLDGWKGSAEVDASRFSSGGTAIDRITGKLSFAGTAAETRGRLALEGLGARVAGSSAAALALVGPYSLSPQLARFTFAGNARARGAALSKSIEAPVLDALRGLGQSPIGPITKAWAGAVDRASRGIDAEGAIRLASEGGKGAIHVDRLTARSASGAHLTLAGGGGLEMHWPGGGVAVDGTLALSGGGLPQARFDLRQRPGGPISGVGRVAPVQVGGARLALGEIRFSRAAAATHLETIATIDGPFNGGRVAGLVIPIRARLERDGGFVVGESCTTIAFRALQAGTFRLGPTRLPLCPTGRALVWKRSGGALAGGASLARLRLGGMLGSSPVAITADRGRFSLAEPGFAASGVTVALGQPESVSRLEIDALAGRWRGKLLAGTYSGLSGKLAAVPLRVSEGRGNWQLRGADLAVDGALMLADEMDPPRFYPLASRNFHLTLAANRIEATAGFADPKTDTHIVDVRIGHELATGRGRALLDVPGIKFDPAYQPEQLTRLTLGVIALASGTLKGKGEIGWDGRSTTSSGTFSTENANLAASFGPVEGLSTTLHFTDLLGLVSAPGQLATTRQIRTGVDVFDGRIRYQLLPGLRVKVEEGLWPFAGGELLLEETILDFSHPAPKRLTFRLAAMDAASFVSQMEFSNINATGTFDGVVPMIFDERGGRIEGGHLVAREPGGTLSYVGELTDKDLGAYGKLAFDALKSLRYSKLIVDLNGSLEGEFIAGIQLDGIARDVAAAPNPKGGISAMVVGRALNQLAKIPFKFNIKVRGPFRTVIGTARSLEDPTNLIQSVLPEMLRDKPTTTLPAPPKGAPVQPKESEPVR